MDQGNYQEHAFDIKIFYKNNGTNVYFLWGGIVSSSKLRKRNHNISIWNKKYFNTYIVNIYYYKSSLHFSFTFLSIVFVHLFSWRSYCGLHFTDILFENQLLFIYFQCKMFKSIFYEKKWRQLKKKLINCKLSSLFCPFLLTVLIDFYTAIHLFYSFYCRVIVSADLHE